MKIYNVLPKGLKSPLMCITYGLQVLQTLLEHIASAFQSLDLIFKAFDQCCIIVCSFSKQHMSSENCWTGTPANVCGAASRSIPFWRADISSGGEVLAPHKPAFWACFALALCITLAAFGPRMFEKLPWAPPEEPCRCLFLFLCRLRDVLPMCSKLSYRAWDVAAELP